ncbi:MAG: CoA transferase [Alphaproteobacteria bacterium]|nr:CoA transferase [Alphaproteobacteria bacterium]MCB9927968.1 CoA transferase [Alphaproteobacteria bacterium]
MSPPLTGIRVADFSRVIAGPLASMHLADLGADVVKIEHPVGGDDTRGYTPPDYHGLSGAFLCYNRNKRSIALDLSVPEGRATARALIDAADVVIENFSTGVMAKFGLDYESVQRPDLIYCSTSAYGRTGPFQKRLGYDPVVQAESGFMSLTGHPHQEPVRTAIPMVDVSTGLTGGVGVLAALYHRKRTGQGQFLEVPLFDTGFAQTGLHATGYLLDGTVPERLGNGDYFLHPVGRYASADGDIVLAVETDAQFRALAQALGLSAPSDWGTNAGRIADRARVDRALADVLAPLTRLEVLVALQAAGVPCFEAREIPEAFADPAASQALVSVPHPDLGEAPDMPSPMRLEGSPARAPQGAPLLGRDAAAVLREWLGYDTERAARLRATGAMGAAEEAA